MGFDHLFQHDTYADFLRTNRTWSGIRDRDVLRGHEDLVTNFKDFPDEVDPEHSPGRRGRRVDSRATAAETKKATNAKMQDLMNLLPRHIGIP